ncbi:MAG: PAC2 family protein [Dehalococcoidia bacterium]
MADLIVHRRPELKSPLLIAAFAGWNDAGESATSAVRFMRRRWREEPFAEIDPEEFYDFTQTRPRVRLEKGERVLEWPQNVFTARQVEGAAHDIILLEGIEPHLAWHAYADAILELCRSYEVAGVITLGALLAEASHTRPVQVNGSSADEALQQLFGVTTRASTYEGPTGIVGVLNQAARDAGFDTASFWAQVPYYVNATPNPKGSLALLQVLNPALGLGLTLHDLEVFAARFDAQVAAEVAKDSDVSSLARQIEERQESETGDEADSAEAEEELPDGASMVEDLERFLREHREGGND